MINYFRVFIYCLIFHKSELSRTIRAATSEEAFFVVSIRYNERWNEFGRSHQYSGALITHNAVVTVGRCLKAGSIPNDYLLVMGSLSLLKATDTALAYRAYKYIIHEKFDPVNYAHDIMIFFLNGHVPKYHKVVHPIALFDEADPQNLCVLYGWQRLRPSQQSDILLKGEIQCIKNSVCRHSHTQISLDEGGYLCGLGSEDNCVGDYGGPLLCNGKLTGLISWLRGDSCFDYECPSLYANISFHTEWIEKTLENSSPSIFITIECVFFYFIFLIIFIL